MPLNSAALPRLPEQPATRAPWPLALVVLTLVVAAVHLWLAQSWLPDRLGWGAHNAEPQRMQVSFVRELKPQQPSPVLRKPPPRVAPAPRKRTRVLALPAELAASAAAQSGIEPALEAPLLAAAQETASAPMAAATLLDEVPIPTAQLLAPELDPTPPAVEWPPSTRLSYTLKGYYRGPVEGYAQVEWLMVGQRYQVFMDLTIGAPFAPLASRRVSSEGLVTAQGLAPSRALEVTQALLGAPRRLAITLDDTKLALANGQIHARPPGVQDSASQFVQLTWLFTTQPDLLTVGRSITLPLALPHKLEPWTYDVVGTEMLETPAGDVRTFHVKPRREPKPGVALTAEIWVAPSLQNLPVRILIRQDAQTYLDLLIKRLPQQAETSTEPPR